MVKECLRRSLPVMTPRMPERRRGDANLTVVVGVETPNDLPGDATHLLRRRSNRATPIRASRHAPLPVGVCAAWWVSHMESDWTDPSFRAFFTTLAEHSGGPPSTSYAASHPVGVSGLILAENTFDELRLDDWHDGHLHSASDAPDRPWRRGVSPPGAVSSQSSGLHPTRLRSPISPPPLP